ncbi:MAG: SpoIID/LytB domain-containing protein [Candidatus Omnitrophota bacterium]
MMYKLLPIPLLILTLFIYPTEVHSMATPPPHKYIPIRVLVVERAPEIILRIKGSYRIIDLGTKEVLSEGKSLRRHTISREDISSEGIRILSEKRTRIYINRRRFRGDIDIIKNEDSTLMVVNHIDLELYLYGVLYHEVSHRWLMEVLKAQAIAARTYALYQKLISKNRYYDLASDIYSQVYGGRSSETWPTSRAVNLTQGRILTYNGEVFPSYYHATCGGHTSDASTIWDIDIPVLQSRICNFCKRSPHYEWRRELTMEHIEDKLQDGGYNIQLRSIEILGRDEAGRILEMILKGEPKDIKLNGDKFRLAVHPNTIKSTNFEIKARSRYITFYGKGWGHGIGMCQWGAYGMARRDWSAEEILEYYYPDSSITRVGDEDIRF